MEIAIVAVGRLKAGPERDLCARYLDRAAKAGRGLGFSGFGVRETTEARAARAADRKRDEADAILAALSKDTQLVCLEEGGQPLASEAFAAWLARGVAEGVGVSSFVIGGADGLDPRLAERAALRLSLSRLTFPHGLARILLAEQFYRAMTILSGHPYHRA